MDITHPLPASALRSLSASLHGLLFTAADPEYGEARSVWNAMIDRHPMLVVRAADVADVSLALAFAREHGLPLAIRSGGHNVAGFGTVEHGLVLDMRALNTVEVDPAQQRARAGGGALLGELDRATSAHGLAVPVGVVSKTGVAGLCLGGGFGWLTRPLGLTVDNLLAADLVTPEGELVHTDATTNPDLLWGLTGGGGNFGVVTEFTFKAHPLPDTLYAGNLIYRPKQWKHALRAVRDWSASLPDQMTVIVTVMVPPPEWELGNSSVLIVGFLWADPDHAAGAACIEEFLAAAPTKEQDISPVSWPDWQSVVDEMFPKGVRAYWKNTALDDLSDEAINVFTARARQLDWPGMGFDIHVMGGAMGRVRPEATAFEDRSSPFWLNIYGFWNGKDRDNHHVAFIRGFHREMQPFTHGGEYVNFSSSDENLPGGFDALGLYGAEKLARLTALKRRYDPHNRLRLNHNIVLPNAG
jgi:FAD/FMN-containing dehydrogenase